MLTNRARYAFKALFRLALGGGRPMSAGELAEADQIPRAFLDQIMMDLRRAGLVQSIRGRNGGYVIGRAPAAISLADVVRLVDGPIAPLSCLSKTAYRRCQDCADESACLLRKVFAEVYARMIEGFETVSLADALAGSPAAAAFEPIA